MGQTIPNSSSTGGLPSYKKPPVNEVVCGMRFHTLISSLYPMSVSSGINFARSIQLSNMLHR
jgi:hypothetical protein